MKQSLQKTPESCFPPRHRSQAEATIQGKCTCSNGEAIVRRLEHAWTDLWLVLNRPGIVQQLHHYTSKTC